jgi:hypothetical protein
MAVEIALQGGITQHHVLAAGTLHRGQLLAQALGGAGQAQGTLGAGAALRQQLLERGQSAQRGRSQQGGHADEGQHQQLAVGRTRQLHGRARPASRILFTCRRSWARRRPRA